MDRTLRKSHPGGVRIALRLHATVLGSQVRPLGAIAPVVSQERLLEKFRHTGPDHGKSPRKCPSASVPKSRAVLVSYADLVSPPRQRLRKPRARWSKDVHIE